MSEKHLLTLEKIINPPDEELHQIPRTQVPDFLSCIFQKDDTGLPHTASKEQRIELKNLFDSYYLTNKVFPDRNKYSIKQLHASELDV